MKIYISEYANVSLISYLEKNDNEICFIKDNNSYNAVKTHADMCMCQFRDKLFKGDLRKIGKKYPKDIIYNAVVVGKYFIHNLNYTDPELIKTADKLNLIKISVNQGYTKCNVLPVGDSAIITSDKGIEKICRGILDVLLIEKGHILLPGMNYGFIGGCSGEICNEIIFNGNLEKHPDFNKIIKFIEKRGKRAKWFTNYPLTDIGSILVENDKSKK